MSREHEQLAALGIMAHQGEWEVSNGDFFNKGSFETGTEEDAICVARTIISEAIELGLEYSVVVKRKFSAPKESWVKGWDSRLARVANPNHTLFFVVAGRDCDGMHWSETYSFSCLESATKEINEVLSNADGPTRFYSLGRDDFESYHYIDTRDRYAEAMGY